MNSIRALTIALLALALQTAPAPAAPGSARAAYAGRMTQTAELLTGPQAEGQIGDFILTNGAVSFVIEDLENTHGNGATGGNVLDAAASPAWSDELGHMFTLLGEWPRQAAYDTVRVENDGVGGGSASVIAVGEDTGNRDIKVVTRYILSPDVTFLEIETSVTNEGSTAIDGYGGDSIDWGFTTIFAPGYGFDPQWSITTGEWIGSLGSAGASYAYTLPEGQLRAAHGASWSELTAETATIEPGGSMVFTRFLVAGSPDLASASDGAHAARGRPTGMLAGSVTDARTDVPIAGAVVDLLRSEVAPYTQAVTDSAGRFGATLPPLSFIAKVSAPEYVGGNGNVYIEESATASLDIRLWPLGGSSASGDTLTVIMRPILSVPVIATPGETFVIEALAHEATSGWSASISHGGISHDLDVVSASYEDDYGRWFINVEVPEDAPAELYDLTVEASGGLEDTERHAVNVKSSTDGDFYFIHVTDTHMPTHRFYYQSGAESDSTEIEDFRAVIEDVNIINPAFVIHTGDLVNEGELENYLDRRYFTKAKRVLGELEVPVYVTAGNHDIGGWDSTPPSDGTSRRDWWKFFGWRYLNDPSPGDDIHTQNYSFDYGGAHFTGLEAYNNYDRWRYSIYGSDSFTWDQRQWLASDLSLSPPSTPKIVFYHMDFQGQLDIEALGIDCALWGHIHSSSGSITEPPYNLSLEACCDGERTYRLIRVSNGTITPSPTLSAGADGSALRLAYDSPNDGTATRATATVTNTLPEPFEHAMVRFCVSADSIPYAVEGGELLQTVVDGDVATCYANVPVAANSVTSVSIEPTEAPPEETETSVALLRYAHPNPARTGTTIQFVLPSRARVRVDVFDVAGRKVAVLADDTFDGGSHDVPWDLRDADGHTVASGVYFCRLETGDESVARKLIVLK